MRTTIVNVPTVTFAVKVKKLLSSIGVQSRLVKSVKEDEGCVYGILIDSDDLLNTIVELKKHNIPYSVSHNYDLS